MADETVAVTTVCDPEKYMMAAVVASDLMPAGQMNIKLHFPCPTGEHADDAMDWQSKTKHSSRVVEQSDHFTLIERTLDDITFHVAGLGAYGILPDSRLVNPEIMRNTLLRVCDNWNWEHAWGRDYPMTVMCAARLGESEMAVRALLMDKRTHTYLPNGHNYQDKRLRVYLPGNGGLLTAVAMMTAGWNGPEEDTPGFPDDGTWDIQWDGLSKMP